MIHLSGCHTFDVPRELVWPRIFDPISLMGLIPGCEEIRETAPGEYHGRLRIGISAIRGTYQSFVRIVEEAPPEHCVLEGELSGPTGIVRGQASFSLVDAGLSSQLRYEGEGLVTGALASVNHRFIERIVESFIKIGLVCLNKQLVEQPGA